MSDAESPVAGAPENEHEMDDIDNAGGAGSDHDSDLLSDVDEDQFEDYDPTTAQAEDRPVDIDEDIAKSLKVSRRRVTDGDKPKKPKEGRREKKKKKRDQSGGEDEFAEQEVDNMTRPRKSRRAAAEGGGQRSAKERPQKPEENEENLTPEERRRRALDRVMDAALKNPTKRRRKKDEVDLEDEVDEQIASLKIRMENACIADNNARESGMPATHKLKLLPDVVGLINRNNIQHAILDPETNFLQSVKYFLEPLNDGTLPGYNIQRDIFMALTRLPIEKETLLSSGIGKVVFFYTRSKRPEPGIKRMAERLVGEWSRPILKRTDDYKKRYIETREYTGQPTDSSSKSLTLSQRPAQSRQELERARMLAPVVTSNRARPVGLPQSYTIAPRSNINMNQNLDYRPLGSTGIEAFRRMTQKKAKKA